MKKYIGRKIMREKRNRGIVSDRIKMMKERGEKNFFKLSTRLQQSKDIYMHYFDFKLFLAWILLYSLLHT